MNLSYLLRLFLPLFLVGAAAPSNSVHSASPFPTPGLIQRPTFTYVSGGVTPSIPDGAREAEAGYGFEGGRVVREGGAAYLFTAEFKGWPINANMRIAIWRTLDPLLSGPWVRLSTIAESMGNGTTISSWNKTCSADNLDASPWAPFPVFDEDDDRWHIHWVSYACDLSWVVRVGIGNIMGASSSVVGRGGIEGPYLKYDSDRPHGNGVVIGPNASTASAAPGSTATRWGALGDCAACHAAASTPPVYCSTPPCQFDNGITGAAICTGPYALPPGAPAKYAAFLGLDHDLAWSQSMKGPWTVGTAYSTGQQMMAKIATRSSMYTENPVVTTITLPGGRGAGYVAVFDTVSPSGGWVADAATGKFVPGGRGESYGFGVAFSLDGQYWSDGVDVALPGGCRTPLGMLEDDGDGGAGDGASFTLVFTRRFADCAQQILPPGSRGDGANDKTMCANLYTARFNVSWGAWV